MGFFSAIGAGLGAIGGSIIAPGIGTGIGAGLGGAAGGLFDKDKSSSGSASVMELPPLIPGEAQPYLDAISEAQKLTSMLTDELRTQGQALLPTLLQAVGASGGLSQEIRELTGQRLAAALRGEDVVDPALERSIQEGNVELMERLQRQLGGGALTSTAGIKALAERSALSDILRHQARQSEIAGGTERLLGQEGLLSQALLASPGLLTPAVGAAGQLGQLSSAPLSFILGRGQQRLGAQTLGIEEDLAKQRLRSESFGGVGQLAGTLLPMLLGGGGGGGTSSGQGLLAKLLASFKGGGAGTSSAPIVNPSFGGLLKPSTFGASI